MSCCRVGLGEVGEQDGDQGDLPAPEMRERLVVIIKLKLMTRLMIIGMMIDSYYTNNIYKNILTLRRVCNVTASR